MLYFSSIKQAIVNADSKKVFWAFDIVTSAGGFTFSDEGGFTFSDEGGFSFDDSGGGQYYWSTVSRTWNGNQYSFKVIPESFNGVTLNRNKSELGLHSPNILEFDIVNPNNSISTSIFTNANVTLTLVLSDYTNEEIVRQWNFVVKRVDPGRQILKFYCEDDIFRRLKGDYPNTKLIKEIFPNANTYTDDNVCISEPYGTCYIPLRSVYDSDHNTQTSTNISAKASTNNSRCKLICSTGFNRFDIGRSITISGFASTANNQSAILLNITTTSTSYDYTQLQFSESEGFVAEAVGQSVTLNQGSRTYLLGSTAYTFTINQVRSPRDWGKKSEWGSTSYTFEQSIKTNASSSNYRTFQPIIHDVDNDGTADAPGLWQQGEIFLDVPTKFSRSDTTGKTNPADVIKNVLTNIGVPSTQIKGSTNLIGYWSFNQGQTTDLYDASGSSANAEVYGSPAWSTGKVGNAVLYSSSSHYAKTTELSGVLSSCQISVSCWVKLNSMKDYNDIVVSGWVENGWIIGGFTTGLYFGVGTSSGGQITSYVYGSFDDGNWHHLCGTYNGDIVKLFVDTTRGTTDVTGSAILQTTNPIGIGARPYESSTFTDGYIDEVRIYNKALSTDDVEELYYNPSMRGHIENARDTYKTWNLDFNGAFWYKETREKKLSNLLNMCHSVLQCEDKIELRPLLKDSQYTIDDDDVLTTGKETDESSFNYQNVRSDRYSDSGYIAWQQSGESQDKFLQLLVAAKSTKTIISNEVLEIPFVQDSQLAQKIGILYYQRKLLRIANISFMAKSKLLSLQPDDVISVNESDYGGSFNILIESVRIHKDLTITISCIKFSQSLDNWDDLSPSAIVVYEDDTSAQVWEPVIAGPLTNQDLGLIFQRWAKPFLVVAQNKNQGHYTDIQQAINALEDENYVGIQIKNGTYTLTDPVYFIDRDIEVVGESEGGVIIIPPESDNGFIFHNLTKQYGISKLTFNSPNTTSFSQIIKAYGDGTTDNLSCVDLKNISFNLTSGSSNQGDTGIYLSNGKGSISIEDVTVNDGAFAIDINGCNKITISNNIFENQKYISTFIKGITGGISSKNISFVNNKILKFRQFGVYVNLSATGVTVNDVDLSFNQFELNSTNDISGPNNFNAIVLRQASRSKIVGNTIVLDSSQVIGSSNNVIIGGIYGIYCENSQISNNIISSVIQSSSSYRGAFGIAISRFNDGQVNNNTIKIDTTSTGDGSASALLGVNGINAYLDVNRNVIQGNNIDLTNNRAIEIGIKLGSSTYNNQGGDNVTYNCGVSISDSGSSNAVTAKDI